GLDRLPRRPAAATGEDRPLCAGGLACGRLSATGLCCTGLDGLGGGEDQLEEAALGLEAKAGLVGRQRAGDHRWGEDGRGEGARQRLRSRSEAAGEGVDRGGEALAALRPGGEDAGGQELQRLGPLGGKGEGGLNRGAQPLAADAVVADRAGD